MTISAKLATDFVKRYFYSFEFDSQPNKISTLNQYHVHQARVRVVNVDIKMFCLDTGSTGCTMVLLPEKLCGKLTLEEALNRIDKEDMDMEEYLSCNNKWVRVTTNRLMILEKLMRKSGCINPFSRLNIDQKEQIAAKIFELQSAASKMQNDITRGLDELWEMLSK